VGFEPDLCRLETTEDGVTDVIVQMCGNDGVFTAGMQAIVQLSAAVGPALNPHLKVLLSAVKFHCTACESCDICHRSENQYSA